jgi:dTDP-4-dehydrorhamnose 3,5-epimerase
VQIRPLRIQHCFVLTPVQHADDRGVFLEWFRGDELEAATGRRFDLRQANMSVSGAGVARGIHVSDVPPGQAKYVTAVSGSVTDYLIDLRVGSATFGEWEAIELDTVTRSAVFIPEGVGHAFVVEGASATVAYLTTDVYKPEADRTISLLDPAIGLPITPTVRLSPKDAAAPLLADADFLPTFQQCVDWYAKVVV